MLGKVAYDTFREHTKITHMSPWERLPANVQGAWTAAGQAAGNACVQWTSVEDVLPDTDQIVLIACPESDEPVWLGYLDADDRWLTVEGAYIEVSHWRSIPAPVRQGE